VYLNPLSKSLILCICCSLEVHSEVLDRPGVESGVECKRVGLYSSVTKDDIAFWMRTLGSVVHELVVSGHGRKSGYCTGFYYSSTVSLKQLETT
jgi:hypothetical protein